MDVVRNADAKTATFSIKQDAQADIRKKAVEQAQETVHKRVDGLGLERGRRLAAR